MEQVHDMMADAMKESSSSDDSEKGTDEKFFLQMASYTIPLFLYLMTGLYSLLT